MPSVLLRAMAGGEEGGSLFTLASASSVDSCKPSNDDFLLTKVSFAEASL